MTKKLYIPLLLVMLWCFPLSSTAQFSIDAELRPRAEYRHGYRTIFPEKEDASALISQRTRLSTAYAIKDFELFVSLQNIRLWGDVPQLNQNDENGIAVFQAWAKFNFNDELTLKVGRQEIKYDDLRFFGTSNWAQQGRAHDAAMFRYAKNNISIDLGLADALRRQEEKGNLNFIGIRHEGAASFAASAYGKLTGKPAACFAIAGPGATNLYTGLWDAKVDRAPLLALTGQVDTQVIGTGNFQELDLVNAFSSVAAFNHRVLHNSKHTELTTLAIKHAILNRDVSHLTFPDEMQTLKADDKVKASSPEGRITPLTITPPKESLDKAIGILKEASRPVIIVGHGARFHMDKVIQLAESLNCPVLTTFKGKGLIHDNHPLGCGVIGRSGTPIASYFMNESDALLVIGASFSKHTGITPKKPTIQIDFDPLALSKFHKVDAAVWGEISVTVSMLLDEDLNLANKTDTKNEIAERWTIWREEKKKRLLDDHGNGISAIAVFDELSNQASENAVMTVDVGNNAYSFGRYFESKKQSFIMSGYLGSIGFAFPAAMGAWAAVGDTRPIIAVAGDGGFCQYLAELTTAVKYKMPIKLILINNNELGKISKEQRAGYFDVWSTSLVNPDFAEYANGCGALGIKVDKKEDLIEAMKIVLNHKGPALLEVLSDVSLIQF